MSWTYEQKSGVLLDPSGAQIAKGYAGGECGKQPKAINNPDFESTPNVGPLPRGSYTMLPPVNHPRLGPFAIPLIPDPTNVMFGRFDFFVHGDTTPPGNASDGCIIMPRDARIQMWSSDDHALDVT